MSLQSRRIQLVDHVLNVCDIETNEDTLVVELVNMLVFL